ncbi:MAG: KR domain-containing protein [Gemmatimonadetes bacterium]|nr:KR domain-containing protein [Gemmatimonadota bacterium]
MRVVVLGATGQTGRVISRLLLDDRGIDLVVCGRSETRLTALASALSDTGRSISMSAFDLADTSRLDSILESADAVVGATSSWRDGPRIAERAVHNGTSYLGIYMSTPEKWTRLRALQGECLKRQIAVVGDGGLHPGLPGAMIRFVNEESPLTSAWVGGKFALSWSALDLAPETILDFVSELRAMDPAIFLDGEWARGYRHARRFDFGDGGGPASCVPMCLEEVRELVNDLPELRSAGFFIAGFGPWVDYGLLPLALALGRIHARSASRLFWWGLRRFASSEEYAALSLEGTARDGRQINLRVSHRDPYALTAISAAAAVRQLLAAPRPGVWTQAAFVQPRPFFESMQEMGAKIELTGAAF